LGDIPGLGFFFKSDIRAKVRKQIVLLITPRIIASAQDGEALAQRKEQTYHTDADTVGTTPTVPALSLPSADSDNNH
jgi:type II secretory pathway component GspD/PulD (secretin)